MTVTRRIPGGLMAFPDSAAMGCVCYSYDPAATAADLAADSTLFSDWTAMMLAVSGHRTSVVEIIFLNDADIPTGTSRFPPGSSFTGADYYSLTFAPGTVLQGLQRLFNLSLERGGPPVTTDNVFLNEPYQAVVGCEVSSGGGTPFWGFSTDGCVLELQDCGGLGVTSPVIEGRGNGFSLQLVLVGGVVLFPNALSNDGSSSFDIKVQLSREAAITRAQVNFDTSGGAAPVGDLLAINSNKLGGSTDGSNGQQGIVILGALGTNFTFGSDGSTNFANCVNVGLIYASALTGTGPINLILGPAGVTAFTPGQIVTVVYRALLDNQEVETIVLQNPDGSDILFPGPNGAVVVLGGVGSGGGGSTTHSSVTLVADSLGNSPSDQFSVVSVGFAYT